MEAGQRLSELGVQMERTLDLIAATTDIKRVTHPKLDRLTHKIKLSLIELTFALMKLADSIQYETNGIAELWMVSVPASTEIFSHLMQDLVTIYQLFERIHTTYVKFAASDELKPVMKQGVVNRIGIWLGQSEFEIDPVVEQVKSHVALMIQSLNMLKCQLKAYTELTYDMVVADIAAVTSQLPLFVHISTQARDLTTVL